MNQINIFNLLAAPGPFAEYADKLLLFGQFVGAWDTDATWYEQGEDREQGRGNGILPGYSAVVGFKTCCLHLEHLPISSVQRYTDTMSRWMPGTYPGCYCQRRVCPFTRSKSWGSDRAGGRGI